MNGASGKQQLKAAKILANEPKLAKAILRLGAALLFNCGFAGLSASRVLKASSYQQPYTALY
jgi:hypothetical protein